jgi:hypothetical protein
MVFATGEATMGTCAFYGWLDVVLLLLSCCVVQDMPSHGDSLLSPPVSFFLSRPLLLVFTQLHGVSHASVMPII